MKAKMITKFMSAILSAAMLVTSLPAMTLAAPADTAVEQTSSQDEDVNLLKLWYDEPASEGVNILSAGAYNPSAEDNNWQQHTLPLGNSFMGANVYGEIVNERLTFNHKTLWNGGPSDSRPDYNGGNIDSAEAYQEVVNAFLAGDDARASRLCDQYLKGQGEAAGYGVYQSWGDIYLKYKDLENVTEVTDYERNLDLTEGVANVDFEAAGTRYHREYFISSPDNVLAMKLTADNDSGMNLNVRFPIDNGETAAEEANLKNSKLGKDVTYHVDAAAGTIVNAGALQDNQMKLNSMLKVVADGAAVTEGSDHSSLDIAGAKEVIIFISANTDYKNSYPKYRTGESDQQLAARVKKAVDNAAARGYDGVKSRHLLDYQELFNRVDLDLGQAKSDKTTDALLAAYKAGGNQVTDAEKRLLEVLLYQYGRYLTIASSREGDLPSNLQGVWQNRVGNSNKVPWGSDFHMNVNLQMNYWPTYSANLAECATPLVDYVNSLREPGRVTAENYYGIKSEAGEANGFTAHTQNSPFGWTCPGWAFSWGWSPAAVPWIIQNCWEYYEYTGDKEYMRTHLYPMMKEETILYDQILVDSGVEITLADGSKSTRLVSAPAYSPELGPYTLGNVYENGLIWQLYEDTIKAAKLLNVDSDLVAQWEQTKERLAPIEIGDSGQIKEWYHETTIGSVANMTNHRHMSHLLELFPGDLISMENEDYMDAAVVSLLDRGDSSTGWGMGQRINAWARTGDGNHAYVLIQNLFSGGIYPNLWDAHPPFQIDGNFGYTSGVNEMLMQSNVGYINILPALPDAWSAGSVNGIVARDNFELGIDWAEGKASEIRILSKNGSKCTVEYAGVCEANVTDSKGQTVSYTAVEGKANRITFDTVKGESYTITGIGEDARPDAPVNGVAEMNGNNIVLTWDAVAGADSYNVYRRESANVAFDKINTEAVTENTFTESANQYEDVYAVQYVITAVKNGMESTRSEKFQVAAPLSPIEVIDETDNRITYVGGWGPYSEAGNYGGSMKFIESAKGTESVELPFEGTGIAIIARKNSGKYSAQWKVYIDGEEAGLADCRAESSIHQQAVYGKYDLPKGQHTVKLTTEGNVNKKIELDAFVVYREADAGLTVTYDLGDKEGNAPEPMKKKCRDTIQLPSCDIEGFIEWNDGTTAYPAGSQFQLSYSDVTFTAVFETDNTTDEYIALPKTGWTATAGSEETSGENGAIGNAIDNNENTYWHSNWSGDGTQATFGEDGQNNEYTIDFGKTVTIDKFEYVPRTTTKANGFITEYQILASQTADGDDFAEISRGVWHEDDGAAYTDTEKKFVVFDEAKSMRRIQIRAIHTNGSLGKDRYIHACEFNAYRKNPNYIPTNTTDEYIAFQKTGWRATAGSEETSGENGAIGNAIDNDENTYWHSHWSGNGTKPTFGEDGQNNEYTIDFGKEITIDRFEYVPRSVVGNGFITQYKLLSSQTADGDDFTEISRGVWHEDDGGAFADTERKNVVFDEPKTMRRIQIRAIETDGKDGKNKFISAVEFNVYRKNPDYISPILPSEIKVENENITLELGESKALNAEIKPANANNKNMTYVSSDPMTVFAYPNGTITASKYNSGTATVTITASGNPEVTKTINVTVNPAEEKEITSVQLEKERVVLKPNEETTIGVAIEPYFGTDKTIAWESSAPNIVTVTDGKIKAIAEGKANITAKTVNNKTAVCQVLVSAKEADRTELLGMVNELTARYKNLEGYTEQEQAAYQKAMTDAEKLLAYGSDVIQSELDEAVEALRTVKIALIKSDLRNQITEAGKVNTDEYATSTVTLFNKAKKDAQTVADKSNATEAEIEKALYDLRQATKGLERTGNSAALSELLTQAGNVDTNGATQEDINAFNKAKEDAETVVAGKFTQKEIDKAFKTLESAMQKLVENKTFTVSFDANGGNSTSVPGSITGKKEGERVVLPTQAPTRDGYTFKGWSLKADGTINDVVTEVTIGNSNLVLFAIWEENTYKVLFDANAGGDTSVTGIPQELTGKKKGDKVDLSGIVSPTRSGYEFKGWSTTADSSTVITEITIAESDITVYAVWEQVVEATYKVSFDANADGDTSVTGMPEEITGKKKGDKVDLSGIISPVRNRYKFKGWSATADGKTLVTELTMEESDITVYAVWEQVTEDTTFKVTFHANAGQDISVTGMPEEITGKKKGDKVDLSGLAAPVRNGYEFKGWSQTADGKTLITELTVGESDIIVYAVWEQTAEETTYKVMFDANAGEDTSVTGMPEEIAGKKKGETVDLSGLASPVRDGYEFKGWSETADGKALITQLTIGESDVIVYAIWEQKEEPKPETYTVTFKGNGTSTSVPAKVTVESGTSMKQPSKKPVRSGYTFQGWSKSAKGSIVKWPQVITKDTTFYAIWKKQLTDGMKMKDPKTKITYQVISAKKRTAMVLKTGDKTTTSLTVPATVTIQDKKCKVVTIGVRAFKGCTKLKKVTIGKYVTEISQGAFRDCIKLEAITIGQNVKKIGVNAFKNSTKLRKVVLGQNVKEIENGAFWGCKKLSTIVLKGNKLKTVESGALKHTSKNLTAKLPKGLTTAQKDKLLKILRKGGNSKIKVR